MFGECCLRADSLDLTKYFKAEFFRKALKGHMPFPGLKIKSAILWHICIVKAKLCASNWAFRWPVAGAIEWLICILGMKFQWLIMHLVACGCNLVSCAIFMPVKWL